MRKLTENDIDSGDLIDIDEFIGSCLQGLFIDYDGFGYLVYDDEVDDTDFHGVVPSDITNRTENYPGDDVTHILWFNR
jgi:hypothetical protein